MPVSMIGYERQSHRLQEVVIGASIKVAALQPIRIAYADR